MGLPVVDNVDNIVILQSGSITILEDHSARGTILLIDAPVQSMMHINFLGLYGPLPRFLEIIIRIMQLLHIPASI